MKSRQKKEWTEYSRHAQYKESNVCATGIPEGKEVKNEKGELFKVKVLIDTNGKYITLGCTYAGGYIY